LEYIVDQDDAVLPTLALMREKMGVKTKYFTPTRPAISIGLKPRFADQVFNNGITTAYAIAPRAEYINSTYPGVEHYGIKGVLHNVQLAGAGSGGNLFDVDVTIKVVAKDFQ